MSESEWQPKVDKRTGRTYYYNKALRQTAWQIPTGSAEENNAWVERVDRVTGELFFYNTITKIRSSKKPKGFQSAFPNGMKQQTRDPQRLSRRRISLKLGNDVGEDPGESQVFVPQPGGEDKFAKLRALRRNQNTFVEKEAPELNLAAMAAANVNRREKVTNSMSWEEYGASRFNQKGGMFSKALPLEAMLQRSSVPLKRPLHKLKVSGLDKVAVSASKALLSFTEGGDNKGLYSFLTYGVLKDPPQDLKDELICQCIRQTKGFNPSPKEANSIFAGWQALTLAIGTFRPSILLLPVVQGILEEGLVNPSFDENTREFVEYAKLRLDRTDGMEPRQKPPTMEEIRNVLVLKSYEIEVFLLNGNSVNFPVDCWTTMVSLRNDVGKYLKIRKQTVTLFGLIEKSEDGTEFTPEENERVFDMLATWEEEYSMARGAPPVRNFLQFRMRLYMSISPEEKTAVELAYHQAVVDVLDSKYPVTEQDLVQLTALNAQEMFGNSQSVDPFGNDFGQYLPSSFKGDVKKVKQKILEHYKRLHGMSTFDAMHNYLKFVEMWPTYGAAVYSVFPLNNPDYPKNVLVAVNAKAVFVIEPNTKTFLSEFPWADIVTWGISYGVGVGMGLAAETKKKKRPEDANFCIVYGNVMQQTRLYFRTEQAAEVHRLLEEYGIRIKGYKKV